MIILILVVWGLTLGSFINALTWRVYQQSKRPKTKTTIKGRKVDLSISTGRSVCVHCGHELAAKDLVPVLSWLSLGGKCRYCRKPIEDSPLVELATALLFVISYAAWPYELTTSLEWATLVVWLAILVGLVALAVYDLRHLILPNRILFPLMAVAAVFRLLLHWALEDSAQDTLVSIAGGLLVGGGIFYVLFQVSKGRWIGGGDVKLGFLIGVLLGPSHSLVALLAAFYIAAAVILPLMIARRVNRRSKVPFGPFLITGLVLSMLWAEPIIDFYNSLFGI